MNKPKVFIGSSTEGLLIAEAIFSHIRSYTEPTIWKHGLFLPGKYPFEVLEEELRKHHFAIMVASPDDNLIKRGEKFDTMRDNILIEFGLFAGVLGRKRTFLVLPESQPINIPSDLIGIIPATYDDARIRRNHQETEPAVQESCRLILKAVEQEFLEMEKRIEIKQSQLLESEKGRSIQKLYAVATKIRDIVLILQTDIFDSFSDTKKFDQVKNKAIAAVDEISNSYKDDSLKTNLATELESLVSVTKTALKDLPYPAELALGTKGFEKQAINTGIDAVNTWLRGGDPLRNIRDKAENEFDIRVASLKRKFGEWWQKYNKEIHKATTELQDAIFKESIKLVLKDNLFT